MAKTKIKRPSLKKAIRRLNQMPDDAFGHLYIDLETLPCLVKAPKEKITANFDADLLERIRKFAKERDASYTTVMNDALRKVFGMS